MNPLSGWRGAALAAAFGVLARAFNPEILATFSRATSRATRPCAGVRGFEGAKVRTPRRLSLRKISLSWLPTFHECGGLIERVRGCFTYA